MILKNFNFRKNLFVLVFVLITLSFTQSLFASTISGYVYGVQRIPVYDVDIELLNENYQLRGKTKSDSSGRYEFGNLPDGTYTIRVLPFRYDYQDQEARIVISTINVRGGGLGNTYLTQDFYLALKKGGIVEYELGVVFAQDIPGEARAAYRRADSNFTNKRSKAGVEELFKAIQIFPDYYDALYRMGKELYTLGQYDDAWKYLLKASEVNPKSGVAFYYLGESFSKLGEDYNKAAVASLKQAAILLPSLPQVFYTLGKVERSLGKFDDAEIHLLKAKKLAKQLVPQIQSELAQLYGNDLKKYKEAADELELYLKASNLKREEVTKIKEKIADLRKKAIPKT